ncbi:hypothetical protein AAKU67_001118 [Oxalobacteraceae bacterium GrIS 2.11]
MGIPRGKFSQVAAKAWLHMGIMGPKRTELIDTDVNSKGPFKSIFFALNESLDLVTFVSPHRKEIDYD